MGMMEQDATSTTCRMALYDRHYCRESDLLIKVNLKQVLPHQRQLQLISIDPELLDYPIMRITAPPELHRSIKEIKDDICDMLWNTLSISIRSDLFPPNNGHPLQWQTQRLCAAGYRYHLPQHHQLGQVMDLFRDSSYRQATNSVVKLRTRPS